MRGDFAAIKGLFICNRAHDKTARCRINAAFRFWRGPERSIYAAARQPRKKSVLHLYCRTRGDDDPPPKTLCSRMRFIVSAFQALRGDVGVDLGCGQMGMAEQLLHAAQIRAGIEEVRGVAVA